VRSADALPAEWLIAKHGPDVKLPDLKAILVNCEKARSLSIHDQCKVVYEGARGRGSQGFAWHSGLDVRRVRATKKALRQF